MRLLRPRRSNRPPDRPASEPDRGTICMSDIFTSPRPSRFGRAVGFRLVGIGSAVPDRVVTNAYLARLGCEPDWIVAR